MAEKLDSSVHPGSVDPHCAPSNSMNGDPAVHSCSETNGTTSKAGCCACGAAESGAGLSPSAERSPSVGSPAAWRGVASSPSSKLDEIRFGKPVALLIREMAQVFSLILVSVVGYLAYSGRAPGAQLWLSAAALVLLGLGYRAPAVLYPLWRAWMALASVLEVVMTYTILGVCWVGMFIPISLALRVFRIKPLDMSFRTTADTHWIDSKPSPLGFKALERQF